MSNVKKYRIELIIFSLQVLAFYGLPLTAGPSDVMGLVLMMMVITLVLALALGLLSDKRMKYLYPVLLAIVFLPTVFIYYNESALVHAIWYLVLSYAGVIIGGLNRYFFTAKRAKSVGKK